MKDFLSDVDRQELKLRHRKERDRRVADRMKAVMLKDKGWSYRAIAEALFLDEETLGNHVKDFLEKRKLKPENGGSSGKLTEAQKDELISHIEGRTYTKASDIIAFAAEHFGVTFTVPGMTSWLKAHGFSYKHPKKVPAKADPERQKAFVGCYEELLKTAPDDEPILFGDGVHPTMATKVSYGWIRKGTDKLIAASAARTRLNIMGALQLKTMTLLSSTHLTLNSEAMADHFDVIRAHFPDAPKIHLILDRGSYNKSQNTRKEADRRGIQLHFLPPYSPNLNPIERVWKVMNEQVRNNRYFENPKAFRAAVTSFFETIWPTLKNDMTSRITDNFNIINPEPSG